MTSDPVYEATCGAMAELVAHGISHVVASPGSRSTPLIIAARWNSELETSMHLDERSAGFHALGLARVTGRPVVLICTSGTAAANYLPAVIEANYTGVPLLVFTADRPPELREIGAGQTINQVNLFGRHVRHFAELAVAGEVDARTQRLAVVRAIDAGLAPRPGPVHLNWPFREPLEPIAGRPDVPAETVLSIIQSVATSSGVDRASLLDDLAREHPRGIIVAGPTPGVLDGADEILAFSKRSGWPIVAEPLSQLRRNGGFVLENADHLLKHPLFADANPPDVVVRIGNSPTGKPLRLWLARTEPAHHLVVDPDERWNDATFLGGTIIRHTVSDLFSGRPNSGIDRGASDWTNTWTAADTIAGEIIAAELDSGPLLEAAVARLSYANTPDDSIFYVSNSMPVRDLDSFASKRTMAPLALGNRGASGIDGVVSSAAGAARTGRSVVLLIGDIATLHDIGGLIDAARRDIDLTIVMVNNNGGGIFSFLPIASHDDVNFDEIFHTPHGTVYDSLPGVRHQFATTAAELTKFMVVAVGAVGTDLIEVVVNREANLDQHRRITEMVGQAIGTRMELK